MQLPNIYAQDAQKKVIDMTLSINPLGCAPAVEKALNNLTKDDVSQYPNVAGLIRDIAKKFAIPPETIVLGNGSEQLIKLVSQTFLRNDDLVMVPRGSFSLFTKESLLAGARVQLVEPDILCVPLRQRPKLLFIANPGTPTGETINSKKLNNIISRQSPAIVVLDEANGEFSKDSCVAKSVRSNNLIVLRTFSKVLGLAGLRVAFATGPKKLIRKLKIIQQPFPVSSVAVRLAQAALIDEVFVAKTLSFVRKEREFLTKKINALGLTVSNSVTNNLFIEASNATKLIDELNKRNVSVINGTFFPGMQKSGFRISIKDKKANRLFVIKLKESLACIRKRKLLRSKEIL